MKCTLLKKLLFSTAAIPFMFHTTNGTNEVLVLATTPKMLKDDNSNNSAAACLLTENQNQFSPTTIQGDLVS